VARGSRGRLKIWGRRFLAYFFRQRDNAKARSPNSRSSESSRIDRDRDETGAFAALDPQKDGLAIVLLGLGQRRADVGRLVDRMAGTIDPLAVDTEDHIT
jgi:hypothetical protein